MSLISLRNGTLINRYIPKLSGALASIIVAYTIFPSWSPENHTDLFRLCVSVLFACQKGLSVLFSTAASIVNELLEARDEKCLLRFQKYLSRHKLLIIDKLGFVPLSKTGAEMLFEVFSQRYEQGSVLVTSNLPFDEWTEIFASERLTGALLDRITHHVHILEVNGDSYRLKQSKKKKKVK